MILGQKSLRIVVAEDDELIGELLGEMLANMGHVVCSIESSQAGTVAAAKQFQPDLMIVDLQLSPGSGVEAMDIIMQTQTMPHVLMSANIQRLRDLRPDAVMLEKPFTHASLIQAKRRAYERGYRRLISTPRRGLHSVNLSRDLRQMF